MQLFGAVCVSRIEPIPIHDTNVMSSLTRILLFFILMLPCCHAASGQTPYSRLELKADRFFSQGE